METGIFVIQVNELFSTMTCMKSTVEFGYLSCTFLGAVEGASIVTVMIDNCHFFVSVLVPTVYVHIVSHLIPYPYL